VLSTGAAPPELGVPQVTIKGHLLVTAPAREPLRAGVASSIIVLPLEDGRLLAGGTFDHGDDEPVVRPAVVEGIRAEMARILPSTRGLAVERAWCCFRPGTPDELPVIDRLPGLENAWMSVGHYRTGVLLAPGAGRLVADWIRGSKAPVADGFSLGRFT
jgi:glycine/D-amino acid oxidase-like deaminating enzyme